MKISIEDLSTEDVIYALKSNLTRDSTKVRLYTDEMLAMIEAYTALPADAKAKTTCKMMSIDFAPVFADENEFNQIIDVTDYNRVANIAGGNTADQCIARLRQALAMHDATFAVMVSVVDLELEGLFLILFMNLMGDIPGLEAQAKQAWQDFDALLLASGERFQWDSAALTAMDIDFSVLFLDANEEDQWLDVTKYDRLAVQLGKKTASECIKLLKDLLKEPLTAERFMGVDENSEAISEGTISWENGSFFKASMTPLVSAESVSALIPEIKLPPTPPLPTGVTSAFQIELGSTAKKQQSLSLLNFFNPFRR